jgi:hypothetical protein
MEGNFGDKRRGLLHLGDFSIPGFASLLAGALMARAPVAAPDASRAIAGDRAAGGNTTVGYLTCTARRQSGQRQKTSIRVDASTAATVCSSATNDASVRSA